VYNETISTSGIPSALKKLERANIHLIALQEAVEYFRKKSPYNFAIESSGNNRWKPGIPVTVTVTRTPPTPDDWALITVDILANARAALDHAVPPYPHQKPDVD
jgi:hypothetical protein